MKLFILFVTIYSTSLYAMQEDEVQKIYLRVIVSSPEKQALFHIFSHTLCDGMQKSVVQSCSKEGQFKKAFAEVLAQGIISRDTCDSKGYMEGFVGNPGYIKTCVKFLQENLGLSLMYHYKEDTYERIGLTDNLTFLGCASYLQVCEEKVSLKQAQEVLIEDAMKKQSEDHSLLSRGSSTSSGLRHSHSSDNLMELSQSDPVSLSSLSSITTDPIQTNEATPLSAVTAGSVFTQSVTPLTRRTPFSLTVETPKYRTSDDETPLLIASFLHK